MCVSALLWGVEPTSSIGQVAAVASDPFSRTFDTHLWIYQSPVGPMAAWVVGLDSQQGLMLVHLAATFGVLVGCSAAVARWVSDTAGRLFLAAFFCSPQALLATTALGRFDIVTVGAATLVVVGPGWVVGVAALALGFNHFEQGVFIVTGAGAVWWVMGRPVRRLLAIAVVGVFAGKTVLTVYLRLSGIDVGNERLDFVRDHGAMTFVDAWRGNVPALLWSVFGVMWFAVAFAWREWSSTQRRSLAVAFGALTMPVLITLDLTRVYSLVTWPLVMFLVWWFGTGRSSVDVRRWTVPVLIVGLFIPRFVLTHGWIVVN